MNQPKHTRMETHFIPIQSLVFGGGKREERGSLLLYASSLSLSLRDSSQELDLGLRGSNKQVYVLYQSPVRDQVIREGWQVSMKLQLHHL